MTVSVLQRLPDSLLGPGWSADFLHAVLQPLARANGQLILERYNDAKPSSERRINKGHRS